MAVMSLNSAPLTLSDQEFSVCRTWLFAATAIELPDHKRSLVASRLIKRLQARGVRTYGEYFRLLEDEAEAAERQLARDLLTTNETYFHREPKHFEFLRSQVLPGRDPSRPFRVWSAASSSGEEAYTIAMELAEALGFGLPWEVVGSDISARVLARAKSATYSIERARLPGPYLKKYCLRGIGEQQGLLRIQRSLRERVQFLSIGLHDTLPQLGRFDVVFLRNVLIYFSPQTRHEVIGRIEPLILPNGYLFVSHSENLQGVSHRLVTVQPSVYRKLA
jgi:chemotaxis protein methyltransferase CheR